MPSSDFFLSFLFEPRHNPHWPDQQFNFMWRKGNKNLDEPHGTDERKKRIINHFLEEVIFLSTRAQLSVKVSESFLAPKNGTAARALKLSQLKYEMKLESDLFFLSFPLCLSGGILQHAVPG